MGTTRKGIGKGIYAAMDFAFNIKYYFWNKSIKVHDWRNNIEIQKALKEEEDDAQRCIENIEE